MELPVELFLALRYLRPRRSFVSVITVLSFLGVTVAVMALIVVLSVMSGFRQDLDKRIIGFNAHITVASDDVIYEPDKIIELIEKQPGVLAAESIIRGPVMVKHQGRISYAYIKSAPPTGDDPVLPLKQYLKMGDFELLGDSVIVGIDWSRRNGALPGDQIEIYGPAVLRSLTEKPGPNHVVVMPDTPIVRGIFKTGQSSYDSEFLLVSTEMAQHIYGLGEAVQGIAVRVKDPDQAEAVKEELNKVLPAPLAARTWMDDNQDLFTAVATERVVMSCILFLIMIVAAFGLCSTLITVTVQKSREIGVMKALGANDLQVCSVFIFHGVVVGVIGTLMGVATGLTLLHYRNPFRDFLLSTFHVDVFSSKIYGLPEIPAVIDPVTVTVIAFSAVAFCVLAALLPAINAARLAPARALRYE